MKKIFTFCVSLLTALSLSAYDFQSGDLFYNITSSSAPYTVEVTQQSQDYYSNYSGVDTIVIPETVTYDSIIYSVTSIGESAFNHSKLTTITIPNTVTSIGEYAFAYCQKLTSVVIGSGVKTIRMAAFNNCYALRTITIPANVKEIYNQAFTGASISTIYMEGTTPPSLLQSKSDGSIFMIFSTTPTCYVPCSAVASYKASTKWKGAVREFVAEFPYTFTIASANTSLGTIAITQQPDCSTAAIFEAIPNTGCYFTQWSDGNTDNPRTLKVTQDTRLTASFASSTYVVNLIAGANGAVSGAGTYDHGTTATITAIPNDGYHFTQWSDGNTDNPRSIVVVEPISLTALFEENYTQEHCQIIYTSTDGDVVTPWVTYNFGADIVSNTYADGQGVITFDGPVTAIGDTAFANCSSLESIIIPDRVTAIGDQAFQYCTYLKDVTIGNRVESIGTAAFNNCSSLQSITIPQSVKYIYNYAFVGASLKSIYVNRTIPPTLNPEREDPYMVLGTGMVDVCYIPCGKLASYQISEWKTKGQVREFVERPSYLLTVQSVDKTMGTATITQDIDCETQIATIAATPYDGYHFIQWSDGNTDNPRTLTITTDTTFIAEFEKDAVDPTWQILYTSTDGNIAHANPEAFNVNMVSNEYKNGLGVITFDGPITQIDSYAFYGSTVDSIILPNTITSIGHCAFYLSSLSSITIPESVQTIKSSAFSCCYSLKTLIIEEGVTAIENEAFYHCSSLTSINLPNSIISIGDLAFNDCNSLAFVYIGNNLKHLGENVFESNPSLTSITWNAISGPDSQWRFEPFSDVPVSSFTFGNDVVRIPDLLCSGLCEVTSIIIPNSVDSIGYGAFERCYSLTSITIPNSVTNIGDNAFYACSSITSITIPENVAFIGANAFSECTSLESIIWNAIRCDGAPFYDLRSQVKSFTLGNAVEHIPGYLCYSMSSLCEISIPESVRSIGEQAFAWCTSLTSIEIPANIQNIGEKAFSSNSPIDTIYIRATTPPTLGTEVFFDGYYTPPLSICYIPCGTLAAYEASDWASQVGSFVEDCPPASAAITYVLNGGVQSEWENPQAMYNELNALWNTFSGSTSTWGELETLKANVAQGIPTLAGGMALDFIADENFKEKFEWLVTYMDAKCTEQGQTLPSSDASFLRYNLQAFFIDGMRTSWPISADYTICGVSTVEAYQPYWKSGFANPTNPTEEFVLNAPYKEGYTFAGWYTNADFSGEKVTTINSETTGTLYAKWVEYIPTIAEVWNMEEGVETKISGVVNWVRYGNVFIQDITGGFRVYIPNDSTRLIPEVGTKIIAKGVRGSFAGSPQLNDAVIESSEPATLADPVVTTLEDLCANPLKYFGQRVFVEVVYVAEYDTYGNIYVAERDGSNKVKGHYMVVDPIAFPVGTKVSITAVASQYDGAFQFEGDIAGIELAPGPKRDTYEYPVRNEKYTLTNDWVISNIEGNFAANKLAPTDSWFVRGMAAKDGIMYFINRETQSLIRVDGATGHMLDPIKITGEHLFEVYDEEMGEWKSDVIYGYNDIKFDQAGNCLIGACTTGGATRCQTFFIYIVDLETGVCTKLIEDVLWDNPSLDQVQFRFDAFGVAGDVTKNGVVMAADAQSWNVYRWLIKNGVVGDGEQINCALNAEIDESLFIETENFGTAPQIFPQDELGELFYVDGASTLPMLFDGDGMLLDDFINVPTGRNVWNSNGDTISINSGHLNGLIEFQVGEEYFLLMAATYSIHNVPSTFALYKFADENRAFSGMEPLWYFPHNGMGSNTNGYRTAVPSVDIIDNNTAKLYLYVGENGYACYTLNVGDNTAEPIDPTWQITYTSSNGNIVTPYATNVFGANIVSNTYENGVGTITFDGPVTSIGDWAFDECTSLTSITIPNSVTSIGEDAFDYCSSLTSITIPESVTNIEGVAFSNCTSLTSMVVEPGNTTYDSRENCNAIIEKATNTLIAGCQSTVIPNTVDSIGVKAFGYCSSLTSITIPNSVTSIGDNAFEYCTSLSSVTLGSGVTSIGDYAFFQCTSLTSVTIPESVTSIGEAAFAGCTSLTSMVVEPGNTTYDSRENCNAIIEKATNTLIAGCQNTVIPNTVTSIGVEVFSYCESLTSITIPNSVTSIGWGAFSHCYSLTSITIPESVTSIGDYAFGDCTSLTSITIPNSVTSIGNIAFSHCTSLTSITIHNSVTSIGWFAFSGCTSLTSITIPNSVRSIEEFAFEGCSSLDTIHVEATTPPALEDSTVFMGTPALVCVIPCGTLAAYEASDWANYMGEFVEEGCAPIQKCGDDLYWEYADGVLTITGTGDMYDYAADTDVPWYDVRGNIKTISLPNAMTKIGQNAFYKCTNMTTINMPTSLTAIGEKAFAQDTKLTGELTLPASLMTIDERAFFNCKAVTAFHIEATTPPTLQDKAFDYTTAPIHVACGYGHIYGKHAQWGVLNLEMCELLQDNLYYYPIDNNTARMVTYHSNPTDTIIIPSTVVIDGKSRTVTEIAAFAFTDCNDLPAVIFSEGLLSIGERAFVRCYSLKGTITLPATLTTIEERAFSYCDNVEKYLLQAMTPPVLGADVFTSNNKNALFYISCETMDDYKTATNWSSLKSRFRDACLNIYHYNTSLGTNGVYSTPDTLVAAIYYRRLFTPYRWETLYLPFEVDRVTVLEDGVEYDLIAWDIVNGGHYFLAKPDGTINKEILFGFTNELNAHTPYIIQFPDAYYDDKLITFYSKQSWHHLSTSFEVMTSSEWMQIAGNTTMQDQLLEKPVYMLRNGLDFILQKTTTTLHPFECYVMPYTTPSGTPARMSVRLRDDVSTAVENANYKGATNNIQKLLHNGQLLILRDGKIYNAMGQAIE